MISTKISTTKSYLYNGIAAYAAIRLALWGANQAYDTIHYLSRRFKSLKSLYESPGKAPWALITGASAGLGFCFAKQLAREGFNLILISRDSNKLSKAESDLKALCPNIEIKTMSADFDQENCTSIFEKLEKIAKEKDIAILVNNLGAFGLSPFKKQDIRKMEMLLRLNISAIAGTTRAIVPSMLQRPSKSAIINVSSIQSFSYIPTTVVNCSSKAFINHFTRTLAAEYSPHKIDCLALTPGYMTTDALKESKKSNPSFIYSFWPCDPEDVAKACLNDLKIAKIKEENLSYGTFKHAIHNTLVKNSFLKKYFKSFLFPV